MTLRFVALAVIAWFERKQIRRFLKEWLAEEEYE